MSAGVGRILVTGATGNVGGEVVRALLRQGSRVRVALRQPKQWTVVLPGIETVPFDFENPASFSSALTGVRGIFLMRPNPVLAVKKTLNRFLDTAASQGVEHCVFLSVAGAETNSFVPHHAVEQHLMRGPLRWTMLRAGFFAQNLTGPYRRDICEGRLVLPAGQGRVAYVDAYDLGEVAAMALQSPDQHSGRGYHLTGPDSLTFKELTALLSHELRRPINYQAATLWEFWRHCRRHQIGFVPTAAYTMIHAALRNGSGAETSPTLAHLLGRPGRSMRDFIERHRAAWILPP